MRINDLTQEERKAFEEYLLSTYRYDAATGKLINKKWNREYPGMINKSNGYVYVLVYFRGEQFKLWKHRLVFFLVHRRFPKEIDHINGIRADNRIENLREVTCTENHYNTYLAYKPNRLTGLPGVCCLKLNRRIKQYRIRVKKNRYFFHDKYMAFCYLILLGRRFQ